MISFGGNCSKKDINKISASGNFSKANEEVELNKYDSLLNELLSLKSSQSKSLFSTIPPTYTPYLSISSKIM